MAAAAATMLDSRDRAADVGAMGLVWVVAKVVDHDVAITAPEEVDV